MFGGYYQWNTFCWHFIGNWLIINGVLGLTRLGIDMFLSTNLSLCGLLLNGFYIGLLCRMLQSRKEKITFMFMYWHEREPLYWCLFPSFLRVDSFGRICSSRPCVHIHYLGGFGGGAMTTCHCFIFFYLNFESSTNGIWLWLCTYNVYDKLG